MSANETTALTRALLESGETLTWSDGHACVDKHSTGGIGDKVSLMLAPMLACFDLRVPMISGRGLGPTGGTLDKLESIPGFRTDLSQSELQTITDQVGCVITGATADLAPADRKLYALRDVTATVPSKPLIVSSILSKKLAENLSSLVLDVKAGSGAFMKTVDEACELGRTLVAVGEQMGVATTGLVTNMDQPLGRMIGNALEVQEVIECLKQEGHVSPDLLELTIRLGSELLIAEDIAANEKQAHVMLLEKMRDGSAWTKFEEMVAAQGGELSDFDANATLEPIDVLADKGGFVDAIDGERLGNFVIALGGGRQQIQDTIDHAVGIETDLKVGKKIDAGESLATVYARGEFDESEIRAAFTIAESEVAKLPLVYDRIG